MAKLSTLNLPREASFFLRGQEIKFKYDAAILTDAYVDEYGTYLKSMGDDEVKVSDKMKKLRGFLGRELLWIDIQDDDDVDLSVPAALENLDWNELQMLNYAVNKDVAVRNDPTLRSEEESFAG